MKKHLIVAMMLFFGLLSQVATAMEDQSQFYGGVGVIKLTQSGMPVSPQESWIQSAPTTLSIGRVANNNSAKGNIFLGYKLSSNMDIELGYIGGGSSFTSATTGMVSGNLPNGGASISVPFSITQSKNISMWHISFVGEKPLNENIKLFGRIGVVESKTDWEQRETYNCNPASCVPYQVLSSSSTKTLPMFGVGVAVKMSGHVGFRAEVMKSSAFPVIMPKADLTFRF